MSPNGSRLFVGLSAAQFHVIHRLLTLAETLVVRHGSCLASSLCCLLTAFLPPSICFPLAAPCNHCAKNSISKNNGRQKIVKPFASVLACAMHIIVREYNIRVTETMLSECMAGSHFVTPGLWQGGGPTRSHMPGFFFSFFSFARFYVFHCVHWLLVARLRIDVGRAQITSLPFIALTHLSSPSQMTHL